MNASQEENVVNTDELRAELLPFVPEGADIFDLWGSALGFLAAVRHGENLGVCRRDDQGLWHALNQVETTAAIAERWMTLRNGPPPPPKIVALQPAACLACGLERFPTSDGGHEYVSADGSSDVLPTECPDADRHEWKPLQFESPQ